VIYLGKAIALVRVRSIMGAAVEVGPLSAATLPAAVRTARLTAAFFMR